MKYSKQKETITRKITLTNTFTIGGTNNFRFVAFAIVFQTSGPFAIATFGMTTKCITLVARFSNFWSIIQIKTTEPI